MSKKNPLYRNSDTTRLSGNPGVEKSRECGQSPFQKDYARLLHSASFRRLQGKTQLFPSIESDFFRNRLTHSLEVAQIAAGIARRVNEVEFAKQKMGARIDVDLVQFAALAHDLGHPPFGHNGEHALDQLMREFGGFEGNAQTLRILAATERKLIRFNKDSSSEYGLDLTYRALASILKYDQCIPHMRPNASEPKKGYYAIDQELVTKIKKHVAPGFAEEKFKTIECAIMDLADDIAYSTYDLEDSLHAGFTTPLRLVAALQDDQRVKEQVFTKVNKALSDAKYEELQDPQKLVTYGAALFGLTSNIGIEFDKSDESNSQADNAVAVDKQVANNVLTRLTVYANNEDLANDTLIRTRFTAERVGQLIHAVEFCPHGQFPQLSSVRLPRDKLIEVELLKRLNYELVIRSPRLAVIEHRGHELVTQIFTALNQSDGALLPDEWKKVYSDAKEQGVERSTRVVCDYVATLTDGHAAEMHSRLFSDGQSIFKPL